MTVLPSQKTQPKEKKSAGGKRNDSLKSEQPYKRLGKEAQPTHEPGRDLDKPRLLGNPLDIKGAMVSASKERLHTHSQPTNAAIFHFSQLPLITCPMLTMRYFYVAMAWCNQCWSHTWRVKEQGRRRWEAHSFLWASSIWSAHQ